MAPELVTIQLSLGKLIRAEEADFMQERAAASEQAGVAKTSLLVVSVIAVLLTLGIGLFVTKRITGPLEILTQGAQIIGKGNLRHRIEIKTGNEVEELAVAFNEMTSNIENANTKLKKSYEELKALDKMKDEFIGMTAHELKTPLTVLTAYIQLIDAAKLGKLTGKQKKAMGEMSSASQRLKNSIDKMLDITQLESGKMKLDIEAVQLTEIIEKAVNMFKYDAKAKNITITTKIGRLPKIYAEKGQLIGLMSNLVNNAIKFTMDGTVTIEATAAKGEVLVRIKDTGKGIAKKDMKQLFTKFFQVDHTVAGSGLGLAICKNIVASHGGKIWAESSGLGLGSTFSFKLPRKQSRARKGS